MKKLAAVLILFAVACDREMAEEPQSLQSDVSDLEVIEGREEYLASPFVAAGDRLYMVGNQDGSFPDIGWHVKGEMGGIWAHPIKLLDGIKAGILEEDSTYCIPAARQFINYPMAAKMIYPDGQGIGIERFQFVPDGMAGMIVEYAITNHSEQPASFTFTVSGRTDLRPVWLGERTGMHDAADSLWYDDDRQALIARDMENDWYVYMGSVVPPSDYWLYAWCIPTETGQGDEGTLLFDMRLEPGQRMYLPITIAGSHLSQDQALATYTMVRDEAGELLRAKKERYQEIASITSLDIPDSVLEQTFRWLKYNTDWLIRDVEGVGRGLSAGIPDYPWWFGADSEYALQGAIMTGQREIVFETIDLLVSISDSVNQKNGRIVHEVSSNGAVFNPGNINETPQFASLIWKVYNWTGDRAFLEKYYPVVEAGLDWLMTERDADGNYLPDGFGMMEIHGLDSEMIDVAAYTQKAFSDAADMAEVLGRNEESRQFREKAEKLAEIINTEFWVEEQASYADFIGTVGQARHLIESAIHRADSLDKPWAVAELRKTLENLSELPEEEKRAFVVYHNWVVNTPMETGVADREKALRALETGGRFTNPFGMYVTGIDRDENAGEEAGSFETNKKIFSYIGAVMTLPTGVQAVAENNYGRPDQALEYLQRMTRSFSFALPGSMYEVSPDYGMIVQAWNIFSYAVPIVEQFFGIYPEARHNMIRLSPSMPTSWDTAAIKDVRVLNGMLSLNYQRENDRLVLDIDWDGSAELQVEFPEGRYGQWQVDGEGVSANTSDGIDHIRLSTGKHRLVLTP